MTLLNNTNRVQLNTTIMKKILFKFTCISLFFLASCGYRIIYNSNKESLINQKYYSLNQPLSSKDFTVIDTGAIYKKDHSIANNETFSLQPQDYNEYLKFYSNGTFLKIYKKNVFTKNDLLADSNSTWRGHFVVNGNQIILEQFYPRQAPEKRYDKKILKGTFLNETLIIDWDTDNLKHVYIKQPIN